MPRREGIIRGRCGPTARPVNIGVARARGDAGRGGERRRCTSCCTTGRRCSALTAAWPSGRSATRRAAPRRSPRRSTRGNAVVHDPDAQGTAREPAGECICQHEQGLLAHVLQRRRLGDRRAGADRRGRGREPQPHELSDPHSTPSTRPTWSPASSRACQRRPRSRMRSRPCEAGEGQGAKSGKSAAQARCDRTIRPATAPASSRRIAASA